MAHKRRDAKGQLRDYNKEDKHENSPTQVKNRVARNRARRLMEKKGKVKKGDGKEVDHIKMLAEGGSRTNPKNLRVISRHANRVKQPKHKHRSK